MTTLRFVIAILAAWRLTTFLVYVRWTDSLLARVGVEMVDERGVPVTFLGKIFGCFWCMSFPVALLCTLLAATTWGSLLLLPLACSGGAIIMNHVSRVFRYAED